MSLVGQQKQDVITKHRIHNQDTGSTEVQIALLSYRIEDISKHFEVNKKDYSSRHGLIKLVGHRRRLLSYLKDSDKNRYSKLIEELGIRK